jgi:hypothetical protein
MEAVLENTLPVANQNEKKITDRKEIQSFVA